MIRHVFNLNTELAGLSEVPRLFPHLLNNSNTLCLFLHPKYSLKDNASTITKFINKNSKPDTKLIFDNLREGYVNSVISFIHNNLSAISVEPDNIFYFTGAHNGTEYYRNWCKTNNITAPINVYACNMWENIAKSNFTIRNLSLPTDYKVTDNKRLFLCFNRFLRTHRLVLISLLLEHNLITDSYTSFFNDNTIDEKLDLLQTLVDKNYYDQICHYYKKHQHKLPLTLNIHKDENANYLKATDFKYYENSYFSLVSETFYYDLRIDDVIEEDAIFFSEKTYKPMLMLHPFILISKPHSLKWLRKSGYKTFSPYIDETYDDIENHQHRMNYIIGEVQRLSRFSSQQWIEWQHNIAPILYHNRAVLLKSKLTILD